MNQKRGNNHNAKLTAVYVDAILYRHELKKKRLAEIDIKIQELKSERREVRKVDTIKQLSLDFEVKEATIKNVIYRGTWS